MIATSATFLDAIRNSHNLAARAVVEIAGGGELELPLDADSAGSVTIDRTADHRRRLDLQIADATYYPTKASDPVSVYGAWVRVYRGVDYGAGRQEMVQLGRFRLEDAARTIPDGNLQITGWDASRQVLDDRFTAPRRIGQMRGLDLIELLITESLPGASFDVQLTDTATLIPKHVVDRDRWAEIRRVAGLLGAEVYPTETGTWRIADVPNPNSGQPVWEVNAGEGGVLVSAGNRVTREGVPNAVIVSGDSVDGNQQGVRSKYPHGYDTAGTSPTRWDGPFGRVPRFYSSPMIKTQAQADRVADAQLANHLGASRTVSFEAVPNPALEAGDLVRITYPDGVIEQHLLDAVAIPIHAGAAMTSETRAVEWDAQ